MQPRHLRPPVNVLFACHVARSTPNQRVPVQHYIVKTQTRETVLVLQPTLPSQSCCIRLPQKMNYTQNGNLAQRSLTTPVLQNENETNLGDLPTFDGKDIDVTYDFAESILPMNVVVHNTADDVVVVECFQQLTPLPPRKRTATTMITFQGQNRIEKCE